MVQVEWSVVSLLNSYSPFLLNFRNSWALHLPLPEARISTAKNIKPISGKPNKRVEEQTNNKVILVDIGISIPLAFTNLQWSLVTAYPGSGVQGGSRRYLPYWTILFYHQDLPYLVSIGTMMNRRGVLGSLLALIVVILLLHLWLKIIMPFSGPASLLGGEPSNLEQGPRNSTLGFQKIFYINTPQ